MAHDIGHAGLAACYLLLLLPLGAMLWLKLPLVGQTVVAVVRMTVQLLLVGFYLQFLFARDDWRLTALWLVVMIGVADVSMVRGTRLCLRCFAVPLFLALVAGTALPLFFFVALLLRLPHWMDPQYVVPIAGMILGNCLRADIVGVRAFYDAIRKSNRAYLRRLDERVPRELAARLTRQGRQTGMTYGQMLHLLAYLDQWASYKDNIIRHDRRGQAALIRSFVFEDPKTGEARSEERRVGKECRSRWSP